MALPKEEETFLNQPIYNIESKTGDIELDELAKEIDA